MQRPSRTFAASLRPDREEGGVQLILSLVPGACMLPICVLVDRRNGMFDVTSSRVLVLIPLGSACDSATVSVSSAVRCAGLNLLC